MDSLQLLGWASIALFAIGLLGVIVRRNVLVMLMCMELMLNGVNLSLVVFAQQANGAAATVLVFLVFVVAAAEIAIAIPIVLLLVRRKHTLDMPPGTRRSYRVRADALGRWAYHCHLLFHMEAGMFREVRVEE